MSGWRARGTQVTDRLRCPSAFPAIGILVHSPPWHRHLRRARQRTRRSLWKARRANRPLGQGLLRRLRHLQRHHSLPQFKELMAQKWDYYTPAKKKQTGNWWHNPGYQKDSKGGQNQAPKKEQIIGFDGKRITLPSESSYVGASASSASEVDTLRGMVKKLSKGEQLNAEEQRSLEESPRQLVAQQQRALNQERKKLNRERALEQKYRQNEEDYNQWLVREKEKYKLALKVEKERYHTEQKRIQLALEQLRNPVPEADSEEEMLPSESEATKTEMEKRCLQAERMA